MPFPDLLPRTDPRNAEGESDIWAEATGVPDNGNNTFELPFISQGVLPDAINEDWLQIIVQPLGPSVTGATFVSLSADKRFLTLNFAQGGGDQCRVTVNSIHTLIS